MEITANLVKELRTRTGAGMMECKKSLMEAQGDIDRAIEILRTTGQAKADNKAGRIAAEGLITIAVADDNTRALLLEVNSETDFVAKSDDFQQFCQTVAKAALTASPTDNEALEKLQIGEQDIEAMRLSLIAKIGENIQLRRFVHVPLDGDCHAVYIHNSRIGVVVDMQGGDDGLAKDIAMHIAASRPLFVAADAVPASVIEKEKAILTEQASQENKPVDIIEKMVQGRLNKYINEITLLGQPYVKDPDMRVGKLLQDASASVNAFYRYEIGEGIEKKKDNFVEEVMAQAQA